MWILFSVLGTNMSCGSDLYAMPLMTETTLMQEGIWIICPLLRKSKDGGKRGCKVVNVTERIKRFKFAEDLVIWLRAAGAYVTYVYHTTVLV